MSAIELFSDLLELDTSMLAPKEMVILEADLCTLICDELKEVYRRRYRNYFRLFNFNKEKENHMIETHFIRFIINDILSTHEYDSKGIAYYTDSSEDVVEELATGCNTNPSISLFHKIIVLHRSVRRGLYDYIRDKIKARYLVS